MPAELEEAKNNRNFSLIYRLPEDTADAELTDTDVGQWLEVIRESSGGARGGPAGALAPPMAWINSNKF
jgi:hypothetical protein